MLSQATKVRNHCFTSNICTSELIWKHTTEWLDSRIIQSAQSGLLLLVNQTDVSELYHWHAHKLSAWRPLTNLSERSSHPPPPPVKCPWSSSPSQIELPAHTHLRRVTSSAFLGTVNKQSALFALDGNWVVYGLGFQPLALQKQTDKQTNRWQISTIGCGVYRPERLQAVMAGWCFRRWLAHVCHLEHPVRKTPLWVLSFFLSFLHSPFLIVTISYQWFLICVYL